METLRDSWPHVGRQAIKPLSVIVVGSGIGGLTAGIALAQTGHRVTIFESVPKIIEVGAGIQLAPNASRILHRLGVLQEVMNHASVLTRVSIRRYSSDNEIGTTPMMPSNGHRYGAPMGVIHRGDLQRILLNAAKQSGCQIFTHHTVVAVDPSFSARVQVHNHKTDKVFWCSGCMVIAADGTKSVIRKQMALSNGYKDQPMETCDAAYRLLIPRKKIEHNPMLLEMLDQNVAMRYMGPGGHVMAYPLKNNSLYNIVLLHPAKQSHPVAGAGAKDSWTSKGDRREMLDFYSGWSPAIREWIEHADEDILEWSLYLYPKIPKWVQGSVALIGDACHPMLPYVAQGAANAIEDAVVLATALTCTPDVQLALNLYEKIRKDRGEKIAASATVTAKVLHLPDGPEQIARDAAIRIAHKGSEHPDKWGNAHWQDFMWGVDVMKDTIDSWNTLVKKMALARRQQSMQRSYSYTLFLRLNRYWPLTYLGGFSATRSKEKGLKTVTVSQTKMVSKQDLRSPKGLLSPVNSCIAKESSIPLDWDISSWRSKPIKQDPSYPDVAKVSSIVGQLQHLPPIVNLNEILALKKNLRDVAEGKAFLLQGGDCAEMFEYCRQDDIECKLKLLLQMSIVLAKGTKKRVVCVGRIAGQYAKPRSSPMEEVDGKEMPSFKGDILNGHASNQREIDPDRLLRAYYHSAATLNHIRHTTSSGMEDFHHSLDWELGRASGKYPGVTSNMQDSLQARCAENCSSEKLEPMEFYTSHEGLLLEYESALTRPWVKQTLPKDTTLGPGSREKEFYTTSAHFLWIGDRTRQLDHAHVEFFRGIANPIGVKIGPITRPSDIIRLVRVLNPSKEPGKITLITRLGSSKVPSLLPAHIRAAEDSEYRRCIVWQCDPMHGNGVSTSAGIKTRHFNDIFQELQETFHVHREEGSYLGGLHLELTGDAVTECVGGSEGLSEDDLTKNYKSFCDPRLNNTQSLEMACLFADLYS
ncbi:hypothetical protein QQS21_003837 [Conoideocrella luteorostrata]|uniref:Phospho-2-dehydro-3-deoxyheptonate aldolase n=1 Tax=Conoideocrella luteorostrata TaxID=1105319 RepID=A0AAJ0G0A8_9HYPO|nr:hypothetical protein QQS21_003837 [Conoideocrella luteorostrata]